MNTTSATSLLLNVLPNSMGNGIKVIPSFTSRVTREPLRVVEDMSAWLEKITLPLHADTDKMLSVSYPEDSTSACFDRQRLGGSLLEMIKVSIDAAKRYVLVKMDVVKNEITLTLDQDQPLNDLRPLSELLEVVDAHHGYIEQTESHLGGTRFQIHLPVLA
ncbi:hypothetical protein ACKC9G_13400 [Pokkaliibacter sp. CJK22405]|uniref:hypothetical protein n=1 Tax=Pokkaliibacter sp. CJK22405 TaxID=3384615 RepID=UPI0039847202